MGNGWSVLVRDLRRGHFIHSSGYRISDIGHFIRIPYPLFRISDIGHFIHSSGYRISDFGHFIRIPVRSSVSTLPDIGYRISVIYPLFRIHSSVSTLPDIGFRSALPVIYPDIGHFIHSLFVASDQYDINALCNRLKVSNKIRNFVLKTRDLF